MRTHGGRQARRIGDGCGEGVLDGPVGARRLRPRRVRAGSAVVLVLGAVLLAGCSASEGAESGADTGMGDQQPVEQAGPVDGAAPEGAQDDGGGAAVQDAGGAAGAQDLAGTGTTDGSAGEGAGRLAVVTGEVGLVADDPRAAADQVVQEVERSGGRVDARHETAARAEEGTDATADLTVRVPADQLTAVLDALEDVGAVDHVDLSSEDVTATSQDLDARIRAMRLSVARMEALLAQATTNEDVIAAENNLNERQTTLEQLVSQQTRLAEQVSLSTLRVTIWAPTDPAPPVVEEEDEGPQGFLDGLGAGWDALVGLLTVVVVVVGVLLPWLALAAVVGLVVVWLRRRLRGRAAGGAGPDAVEPAGRGDGPRGPGDGSGGGGDGARGPGGGSGDGPTEHGEPVGSGAGPASGTGAGAGWSGL